MELILSNSELQSYKLCRRRWWLQNVRGYQKEQKVGPLALGTRIHEALAAYYTPGGTANDALTTFTVLSAEDVPNLREDEIAAFEKEAKLGYTMLVGYFEWLEEEGADDGLEIIDVEKELEYTFPFGQHQVTFLAKRDAVGIDHRYGGRHFFLDHKGQPYSSKVLTPDGWVSMGDLVVGSKIMNHRHQPTVVTGVFELGVRDIYEVSFNDGTSTRCTKDHLWEHVDGSVVELSHWLTFKNGIPYLHLAKPDPDYTERKTELPLDPYELGVFLGDGSFRGVTPTLTNTSQEMFTRVGGTPKISPSNPEKCPSARMPKWKAPLTNLGLSGKLSCDKFVPGLYLCSSALDRLELLRGLMDTDGYIHSFKGNVHFDTTSEQLAEGVKFLVRSLGGWAKNPAPHNSWYYNNQRERVVCRPTWRVAIRLDVNPFFITEKSSPWEEFKSGVRLKSVTLIPKTPKTLRKNPRKLNKKVTKIELVGQEQARCIKVEDSRQLYVTDGYTLTHNTSSNQSFTGLDLDEQVQGYTWIEKKLHPEQPIDYAIWNILRKVLRTARAVPPFYYRLEQEISPIMLANFELKLKGVVRDIINTKLALEEGVDHHEACYPSPGQHCEWRCPFRILCPLFDDGSRVEQALDHLFIRQNPYQRYKSQSDSAMDKS